MPSCTIAAVAHQRDPVGERERLLAVVRDEQHRDAERPDDVGHLRAKRLAQERVDVRPRLVQEHELGRRSEGASERDALLLAAGELVRVAPLEPVETDEREQFAGRARRAPGGEGRSRRSPRP